MAKILLLDIETAPMLGYSWDIWKEQGSMDFIVRDWHLLCWVAKFLDSKNVFKDALPFHKNFKRDKTDDSQIVKSIWHLLDEADIVVTQNGIKFDLPKLNAKFIEHKLPPPSPYKRVDTCLTARKVFSFSSNKLDDLGKILGVGRKVKTGGFELWLECMNGKLESWSKMIQYCQNDVLLLEQVYKRMLPYMSGHPNLNVYSEDKQCCPKCGSKDMKKKGFNFTVRGKIQAYQCNACGGYCQGDKLIKNGI